MGQVSVDSGPEVSGPWGHGVYISPDTNSCFDLHSIETRRETGLASVSQITSFCHVILQMGKLRLIRLTQGHAATGWPGRGYGCT